MGNKTGTPPLAIWWIIWFGIAAGLTVIHFAIPPANPVGTITKELRTAPFLLLALSIPIRWTVLPRFGRSSQALVVFIVGLSMAEACGILGLFLVPDMRDLYYAVAMIGIAQFAPFFAGAAGTGGGGSGTRDEGLGTRDRRPSFARALRRARQGTEGGRPDTGDGGS